MPSRCKLNHLITRGTDGVDELVAVLDYDSLSLFKDIKLGDFSERKVRLQATTSIRDDATLWKEIQSDNFSR